MRSISKALVGTLAAGAVALSAAGPATARERDGVDGGDILAGALVLGGIAAVAAIASDDGDDRLYHSGYDRWYDDRHDRDRYDRDHWRHEYRYGGAYRDDAVQRCIRAAENTAARYSYGARAEVYDIRDIDRERHGFEVRGRIAVQQRGRNYRRDRWDEGRFTCQVRRGRVVDLDYSGIRGL